MKLETQRLILRDWMSHDINDLVEGLNNLEVSKWLAYVPFPYKIDDAKTWIKLCDNSGNDSYEFAIILKKENKTIGGISITNINQTQGTAGGGIWINQSYQKYGYGNEAFKEKIRFCFEELKLRRLENGYFTNNFSSERMQTDLGFKKEGTRRKAFKCKADGQYKDEVITALLVEEWKNA